MKNSKWMMLLFSFVAGMIVLACSSTSSESTQDGNPDEINVYYFHTNARCTTCRTVEEEAKQDIKELYGGKVAFESYNLDEKAGEAKAKELGVNSQVLLIVKGKQKIDITSEGFLYARTNPEKFRQVIQEKIKPLL